MILKNLKLAFIIVLAATTFISCNNAKKKTGETEFADHHTAQNSLDWAGTYSGNLPCADCNYIETELTLNTDLTYELISQYIFDEDIFKADTLIGDFAWEGNNVKLEGIAQGERASLFKVEENQLRQLDLEGSEIKGEIAQQYVMRKNGNLNVEDKRWQLVELNGKEVKGTAETHYIIFHSKEGRLEAKANCNVLLNTYKIKNELQLKIDAGISTLMACPDNLEQEFSEVLFLADNLSVDAKTLTLNTGRMTPLARFELVEE